MRAQQHPDAPSTPADIPAANPSRPTVTNPATLPPVGYLQFEQGYLGSLDSPNTSAQHGLNAVAKIAVASRLMLAVSAQPFAASTLQGTPGVSHDAGAVLLGLQAVLFTPAPPAPSASDTSSASPSKTPAPAAKTPIPSVALAFYHSVFPGSAPDIDLGSASNSFLLLLSGDVGAFHYDTNYLLNEQDDSSTRGAYTLHRAQFGQTLSVNHGFFLKNVQLAGELYHFTQPTVHATAAGLPITRANLVGALAAWSWQARPNLVFDAGFERGLTSTSTHWQSFAGFTYLLPHRLWPDHSR